MKPYKKQLSIVREKIATTWEKSKPKIITGVTIAGAIGTFFVTMYKLSQRSDDDLENWLKIASDEELADEYEKRRQQWMKDGFGGNGERTPEMEKIDKEISRRAAEKWENDPRRNTDPNFRWTDKNRWE
ncbi:MAG: hypothetical protein HDR12_02655 [Lachnospiraceae bacterium]|nr:hypothetical protein [Lachnospiraceae bacterium]